MPHSLASDESNPNLCDHCHRRRKRAGKSHCGSACKAASRIACLFCKRRPKHRRYDLCGETCKEIALNQAPLLLEVPKCHVTYETVENQFVNSWKSSTTIPVIQRIYRIIGNESLSQLYDKYKRAMATKFLDTTERHGISFKTSLANPSSAFAPGIYSSSASNKAYSYANGDAGALIVTKVVLGRVRKVNDFNEVMLCPPRFHSVVFKRQDDRTVIYEDDAIRPVFLILF